MTNAGKRLKVLRLDDIIAEGSAPYYQFTLPWLEYYDISFCVILKPTVSVPDHITVFEGNASVKGTLSALKKALNSQEYDLVHVHSSYLAILYILLKPFMWRRIKFARTIYTLHCSFPNLKLKHKLMLVMVFALFKRIVCCSHASFQSVTKLYRLLAGERLAYITNCADIERVEHVVADLPKNKNTNRPFSIVVIGRLIGIKDPLVVLEAFDRLEDKDSRLLYISRGKLQKTLMARIREKGLTERVTITGQIERDRVFEYLAGSDVYVSSSRGEGLPVAVLEAMASGCPVILSDIPPHREIADGVDFIPLVKVGDVAGFSREIDRFQRMSLAQRAVIGQKCRKLAVDRFSLGRMQKKYKKLYLQLLEQV